ncbi:MAG: toxin-antitoxin system HicB family antitoxin [Planctomycetota bacterium]
MKNPKEVLEQARHLAGTVTAWADLENSFFEPDTGLLTKAYPTREEREEFMKTEEFKEIEKLLGDAIDRSGVIAGATPQKSGRFVVRLPRTLHERLELEAVEEGVSLNQLVVFKLAAQLSTLRTPRRARAKASAAR